MAGIRCANVIIFSNYNMLFYYYYSWDITALSLRSFNEVMLVCNTTFEIRDFKVLCVCLLELQM